MIWVIVGLGIVGAIIALATSWARFDTHADIGTVSHPRIANQRTARSRSTCCRSPSRRCVYL
jgi:hypothetical protein